MIRMYYICNNNFYHRIVSDFSMTISSNYYIIIDHILVTNYKINQVI